MDTITYTLDDEEQNTSEETLTPRQILEAGGITPDTHYLVLLRGNSGQRTSYEKEMDEAIRMHPNMRFLSVSTGPTTVS